MVTPRKSLPFQFIAGNLALDFANTVHSAGAEDPQDDLRTPSDLQRWVDAADLLNGDQWSCSAAELASLKNLRHAIYVAFSSESAGDAATAAGLSRFNVHVQTVLTKARIESRQNGFQLISSSTRPVERLRFEIVWAAMDLLLSGDYRRVRQCAGDNCTWLFLDASRNGRRRWCEMQACGNRAKVRRFRQRLDQQ